MGIRLQHGGRRCRGLQKLPPRRRTVLRLLLVHQVVPRVPRRMLPLVHVAEEDVARQVVGAGKAVAGCSAAEPFDAAAVYFSKDISERAATTK